MTIELKISGMSCQHCVRAVEEALRAVAGVGAVAVDLTSGTARVDGEVDREALVAAVTAAGYEAAPV